MSLPLYRSRRLTGTVATILLILTLPGQAESPNHGCRLVVHVIDDDGQPVPGISVATRLADALVLPVRQETSDKSGVATFNSLPTSNEPRLFEASSFHHVRSKILLTLKPGADHMETTLTLTKRREARGKLLSTDGQPFGGWSLRAYPAGHERRESSHQCWIAADGSYRLPRVAPGNYDLYLGYVLGPPESRTLYHFSVKANVALPASDERIVVDFPSPGQLTNLTGRIHVTNAESIGNIHIYVESLTYPGLVTTGQITDDGRSFLVESLPDGLYEAMLGGPYTEPASFVISVPAEGLEIAVRGRKDPSITAERAAVDDENYLPQ